MPEISALTKCPRWCVDHVGGERASEVLGWSRRVGSGVFIARVDGQSPRLALSAGETVLGRDPGRGHHQRRDPNIGRMPDCPFQPNGGWAMTITAEPTTEVARPNRVAVRDFTIYRDDETVWHTGFESTPDLTVAREGRDYDSISEGKVAVILVEDFTEVLVDDHVDALTQLDRALFHLTAARDRLALMLAADALTAMAPPQTIGDVVEAAAGIGVKPSDVMAAIEVDSSAVG